MYCSAIITEGSVMRSYLKDNFKDAFDCIVADASYYIQRELTESEKKDLEEGMEIEISEDSPVLISIFCPES